jgi:hypothetical protein
MQYAHDGSSRTPYPSNTHAITQARTRPSTISAQRGDRRAAVGSLRRAHAEGDARAMWRGIEGEPKNILEGGRSRDLAAA